jgi:hypothetical protein
MDEQNLVQCLNRLSPEDHARFLARLAFHLTVAGRDTYAQGATGIARPQAARGVNELQHKVLGQMLHCWNDTERYPNDVFSKTIFELASAFDCESNLVAALDFAVR